jgi:carbamate kinase
MRTALVAVGGNSLIRAGETGAIAEQLANTRRTAAALVGLVEDGFRLVVTHGNGPQVGAALLRSERASDQVYSQSLDVCDAATQGEVGYLLQQSLQNALRASGLQVPVATVVSQVVVSADDPAMRHPTKPIGPFYSRADATERARLHGWQIVEDAARGYRRVVPSPEPIEVVEEAVVRMLLVHGVLVVAGGGGGIPVVRTPDGLKGVEAVVDKDRVSALLASRLGIETFMISTDADRVYLDYRRPGQRALGRVTAAEMTAHLAAGQFPPGTMGPKVESALRFLAAGGREVIITSHEHLRAAARGDAGTHIVNA